jgi:hypothetical protein
MGQALWSSAGHMLHAPAQSAGREVRSPIVSAAASRLLAQVLKIERVREHIGAIVVQAKLLSF